MVRALIALLLLAPLGALGQTAVYRTVDEQGNVVFTDSPPAGGAQSERVEVRQPNTAPPPPDSGAQESARVTESAADQTAKARPDWRVAITSPASETTIPMGPGNFSVSADVSPALRGEQSLQLYLDGEPQGEPGQHSVWNLTNVSRGAHDLTVSVLSGAGEPLATSEPVRVYVQRPTVNRGLPQALPRPLPAR